MSASHLGDMSLAPTLLPVSWWQDKLIAVKDGHLPKIRLHPIEDIPVKLTDEAMSLISTTPNNRVSFHVVSHMCLYLSRCVACWSISLHSIDADIIKQRQIRAAPNNFVCCHLPIMGNTKRVVGRSSTINDWKTDKFMSHAIYIHMYLNLYIFIYIYRERERARERERGEMDFLLMGMFLIIVVCQRTRRTALHIQIVWFILFVELWDASPWLIELEVWLSSVGMCLIMGLGSPCPCVGNLS